MSIIDSEKLSDWEKRPKEYLTAGVDEITKRFIGYCSNEISLDISYQTRDGRTENRTIYPKRVLKDYLSGNFYTEAFCSLRNEIRVFNLKKIYIQNTRAETSFRDNESELNPIRRAIPCKFYEVEIANDEGFYIDSVEAICGECGHKTWSYGRTSESRKRCLAVMQEDCPSGAMNWYIDQ